MATNKNGLLGQSPTAASPTNPNGTKTTAAPATAISPYQGGLTSDFSGLANTAEENAFHGPDGGQDGQDTSRLNNKKYMSNLQGANGTDPDVVQANYQAWQLANHPGGMDTAESQALFNMYQGRIGEKNSLASQIAGSDSQLAQQQDLNKATAGSAVGEGLKNTRQNYNDRGLLYSGARQGGEAAVRASGASQLASSMAGTARDAANAKTTAQNAYASVDLANQQDSLNRATQAFDTANANNIARLQAFQQLGSGLGSAAGSIAGSQSTSGPSYQNPASGWAPSLSADGSLGMPAMGSQYQYNPNSSQGLLGGTQNQQAVGTGP